MEVNIVLNSILTASSILVAVGFPFIIFIVTDYKNKKGKLLEEIKAYYPKLNSFRKLIYYVFKTGIIKNYDLELFRAKTDKEKEEVRKNEVFPFFKAFKYISEHYTNDIMDSYSINRFYSYEEVKQYQIYANAIWYYIDCRTDIKKELNNERFENLDFFDKSLILEAIADIDSKYLKNKLTISVIASIAGDFEVETANDLVEKTLKYQTPIPKVVKLLFIVLAISVILGVILPLFLLQFPVFQSCLLIMTMTISIIFCFFCIVWITGKYIWRKKD